MMHQKAACQWQNCVEPDQINKRNLYNQIHIKPLTPKGKTDKYNKYATKWTDGKQSLQLFQ